MSLTELITNHQSPITISFIVPLYNAEETVGRAIESILSQQTPDRKFEMVVVDDGSTDSSVKVIQGLVPKVKLVTKPNGGEASALNEGLRHCTGDFVAIVEADVELYPDWLNLLLKEFEDPAVIGAGGYLVTAKQDPWIARLAGYEVELKFANKERYPKHITSAASIYRKKAFDLFGNFDESLRNASLDSDFNSRVIKGGYKLTYTTKARAVHHYKRKFFAYLKRQYAYARYRMYVNNLELYPADRSLVYNVAFCGLALCSLALLPFYPQIPGVMFILAFLIQFPQAYNLWRKHRDRTLVLYPAVTLIRNIVAFIGYFRGKIGVWSRF